VNISSRAVGRRGAQCCPSSRWLGSVPGTGPRACPGRWRVSAALPSPPRDPCTPSRHRGAQREGALPRGFGRCLAVAGVPLLFVLQLPTRSRAVFYTEHVEQRSCLPETRRLCHFRLCHKIPRSAAHLKVSRSRTAFLFYFCMQDSKALFSYNAFMVPRDKIFFKKGSSGEIPVKWEAEACQQLWNLSQALRGFPALGVKHTIHPICIFGRSGSKFPAAQQKERHPQGASEEPIALPALGLRLLARAFFPGVKARRGREPLGTAVLSAPLGPGLLISSQRGNGKVSC